MKLKLQIVLFILQALWVSIGSAQTASSEPVALQAWRERLTSKNAGEVRVQFYCDLQKAAADYSSKFVISENVEGLVFITELTNPIPPMPVGLTALKKIKESFVVLSNEELQKLTTEEQDEYKKTLKRLKGYDKFMDYINSLTCYKHSSTGARFSIAKNLTWREEKLIDSNLKAAGWKIDVYEAYIDTRQTNSNNLEDMDKKYILIGPCRAEVDPSSSTGQLKQCLDFLDK